VAAHEAACLFPLEKWPLTAEEMRRPALGASPDDEAEPLAVAPAPS
jgi:hypothetical protein